jgi:predicted ABC-type ATPase
MVKKEHFYFFWLNSPELAIERVKRRVMEGGHNIKTEVIKRRYFAGIKNLFDIYMDIVDNVRIFDNSLGNPTLIGKTDLKKEIQISDIEKYNNLKSYYGK